MLYSDSISKERKMSKWWLWALFLTLRQWERSHPSLLLHREASCSSPLPRNTYFQQLSPVAINCFTEAQCCSQLAEMSPSNLKSRRAAALRSFCGRLILATPFFFFFSPRCLIPSLWTDNLDCWSRLCIRNLFPWQRINRVKDRSLELVAVVLFAMAWSRLYLFLFIDGAALLIF